MKEVFTIASTGLMLLACGSQPATPQAGSNEVMPKAVELVQPAYPEDARQANVEGTAIVEVAIGADGAVLACSLATSSGNGALDQAATEAARNSKFAAGTRDGTPVEMKLKVPFRFKLADKHSERRIDVQDVRGVARLYEPAMPAMEV